MLQTYYIIHLRRSLPIRRVYLYYVYNITIHSIGTLAGAAYGGVDAEKRSTDTAGYIKSAHESKQKIKKC